LPESNLIYQISKGVASGHGLTSIITTLCAYNTIATGMNKVIKNKNDLKRTFILNAGDDCNIKMPVKYLDALTTEINTNSGHTIDDLAECAGYLESDKRESRVTLLKKKFNKYSWNDHELMTNLLNPSIKDKNRGYRAQNLQVLLFQSPFDMVLNHKMITLIIAYILSGDGSRYNNVKLAQVRYKTIMNYETLYRHAKDIGFHRHDFIDKMLELDYGYADYYNALFKYSDKINVDAYIKAELRKIKKTLIIKYAYFNREINYFMHRGQNVLRVFDAGKSIIKPYIYKNLTWQDIAFEYNNLNK
jgi:hypothetical protein